MFKKQNLSKIEVDFQDLKNLQLFECLEVKEPDCNGLSIYYIRVINGFIRCASNANSVSQVFIPFTNK